MTRTWRASSPRPESEGAGRARPFKRRAGLVLLLAALALLVVTVAALAVTGDLTQPVGTAGCISETGAGPCANGHALNSPHSVAVSADGKSVYATSQTPNAVVRFYRDTTTGWIAQPTGTAGCVSETGAGACANGHALTNPGAPTVSPDGKSLYVTSDDAVVRFNRNPATGAITQAAGAAGCLSNTGAGPCVDGHALNGASGMAVSPDGKSVYVGSFVGDAVVRFNRNPTTGAITQPAGAAGCVSNTGAGPCVDGHALNGPGAVAVSPDGKSVYVTSNGGGALGSYGSDAVVRFNRNPTTGAITQPSGTAGCVSETGAGPCADGHALALPTGLAASPDGKSVYLASQVSDAVTRFNRNPTTGAITQPAGTAGCVSDTGTEGTCSDGRALNGAIGVAVSPDGKSVYLASWVSTAVARLDRDTTTGAITQPAGAAGCVSNTGAGPCVDGHALNGPTGVAVSPDGKSVYAAVPSSTAVARFNRAP